MTLLRTCLLSGLIAAAGPALSADEAPKVQVKVVTQPGSTAPGIKVAVQDSNAGGSQVQRKEKNNQDTQPADKQEKKKKAVKKEVQVQATAAGAVFRGGAYGNGRVDRQEVDAQDNVERVLLFTPGTPIIAQLEINIDGKPFRTVREQLLDEMLAEADTDKDGKATWKEALENPRFLGGRFRYAQRNEQQRAATLKALDRNSNELVDKGELRQMVAQQFGGPTFNLNYNYRGQTAPDIKKLLDADNDGTLDKDELAGVEARLKSRDANANDLVETAELGGTPTNRFGRQIVLVNGRRQYAAPSMSAVILGPLANFQTVHQLLVQNYGGEAKELTKDSFARDLGLFVQLDADKDGTLQPAELESLNQIKPHLELSVGLGEKPAGITVKSIDPKLGNKPEAAEGPLVLELAGARLKLSTSATVNRYASNYERYAKQMIDRLDTDKNGYIEKKETEGNNNRGFAQQFAAWDRDEDGKVYAKEITEAYNRQQAPMMSMVTMAAYKAGNPFFAALDASGDGRLSLREMKYASDRLAKFDTNQDGQISQEEVPTTIEIALTQGYQVNYGRSVAVQRPGGGIRGAAANNQAKGPDWFVRMDRNGDGDVTLKEFLGEEQQFQRLDLNQDGFLTPEEAEQAGQTQTQAQAEATEDAN